MSNQNQMLIGAAMIAGVLGTLKAVLNRKTPSYWDSAKDAAEHLISVKDNLNKNFILGGVAGGLIGMTTALLFAPKSGQELIQDLCEPFENENNSRKGKKRSSTKKKHDLNVSSSSKSSRSRSSSGGNGRKKTKKSAPRRSTRSKSVPDSTEKAENETAEMGNLE